ncbi:class C sortase [Peptostreptococcus porci]|uniref:class C sortase n=1 Tax=Peptostreptococcus porci TaxID=2652282 RepID=UPI0023F0076A|nr:class C sortase [Peptostreptococcus porci]MDD7182064.1 class C sortase [Peptostreptococcus porci]MDY5964272.1 class C sortase [Peptostreptococcus porci]
MEKQQEETNKENMNKESRASKKKSKKNRTINNIINVVILVGVLVILYPFISQMYYSFLSKSDIKDFDEQTKTIQTHEVKQRMDLAKAYNESLRNVVIDDPYVKKKLEEGKKAYAKMLEVHEKIGHISIPKMNEELAIYAGTSESVLQKGVGHMEGTSLPIGGKSTHSVLTAHSGIPKNRLFTDLNKLEKGDHFYVTNIGETLAYEVDQIKVIEPSKFDDLQIVPGRDYATLLTCTPYMVNSHRLIVRGHRIPYDKGKRLEEENNSEFDGMKKIGIISIALILVVFFVLFSKKKKKAKKEEKTNKNDI